jgi:hypothetical protein
MAARIINKNMLNQFSIHVFTINSFRFVGLCSKDFMDGSL